MPSKDAQGTGKKRLTLIVSVGFHLNDTENADLMGRKFDVVIALHVIKIIPLMACNKHYCGRP